MNVRLDWQAPVDRETLAADWVVATGMRTLERRSAIARDVITLLAVVGVAGVFSRAGLPVGSAICTLLVGIPVLRFATSILLPLVLTAQHYEIGFAALENSTLRPTVRRQLTLTATDAGLRFTGGIERSLSWSEVDFCEPSPGGGLVLCLRDRTAFVIPSEAFDDADAQQAVQDAFVARLDR